MKKGVIYLLGLVGVIAGIVFLSQVDTEIFAFLLLSLGFIGFGYYSRTS